jgi:hypothetical protein
MLNSGIDAGPFRFMREFCAFDVNLYLSVIMGVISGTLVLPAIAFWHIYTAIRPEELAEGVLVLGHLLGWLKHLAGVLRERQR